jgi:predicted type IV restriction endonuclease
MNELLADIKAKLQNGDYKNEEHIRLSLVARILQNLGWDIWNPKEETRNLL